jgi:hypothetical protein
MDAMTAHLRKTYQNRVSIETYSNKFKNANMEARRSFQR